MNKHTYGFVPLTFTRCNGFTISRTTRTMWTTTWCVQWPDGAVLGFAGTLTVAINMVIRESQKEVINA